MYSWLHDLTGIPSNIPILKEEKKTNPNDFSGWFSTHAALTDKQRKEIIKNAFPIIPHSTPLVASVGKDGAIDNTQPAKNLFTINQQQIPDKLFAWYISQGFIGYQACALIAQHWLIDRCCTLKGRDAVRNGFTISFNEGIDVDPGIHAKIETLDKRFNLKKTLTKADKFKNVFGLSHTLFVVDSPDPDYYEKPFNPDGITAGSYKGMTHIDPYWVTPLLTTEAVEKPDSMGFYEPTYWVISGKKYHKSHFAILRGPEVSDIIKPSYLYGGLPLTQLILERVYGAERTANEAPMLALTKRLIVRYMEDLESISNNPAAFEEFLSSLSELRDNYGVYVESNENKIEQQDTSLADFDTVVMTQYQIVAGISGIPATKLMGTSPKGFQSTGEHEVKTYHEDLESIQENDLEPIVNKHHICLMRSHIAHQLPDKKPLAVSIVWKPMAVLSDKEQAETNELKSRTARSYQESGAIDEYDIRDSLIADENSGFSGIEAVDRPDELVELDDPTPVQEFTPFGKESADEIQPASLEPTDLERPPATEPEPIGNTLDVIRKERRSWFIYSKKGDKIAGPFSRKYLADKRLGEIEAAKHAKES